MSNFRKNIFLAFAVFVILTSALSGVATASFASHAHHIPTQSAAQAQMSVDAPHGDHGAHHTQPLADQERTMDAHVDHCAGQAMGACCPMLSLPTFQAVATLGDTLGYRHAFDLSLNSAYLGTLKRPPKA